MAVSKRLRYEVLLRDNHTCRYCGAAAPEVKLTIDHVVPVALGGKDEPGNLVTACMPCNSGKSSTAPGAAVVADVDGDALRWARAQQRVVDLRSAIKWERDRHREHFRAAWNGWTYEATEKVDGRYVKIRRTVDLPEGWEHSIDRFYAAGVDDDDIREAVSVAMTTRNRNEWRYFCGVMWNVVDELIAQTKSVLATRMAETTDIFTDDVEPHVDAARAHAASRPSDDEASLADIIAQLAAQSAGQSEP